MARWGFFPSGLSGQGRGAGIKITPIHTYNEYTQHAYVHWNNQQMIQVISQDEKTKRHFCNVSNTTNVRKQCTKTNKIVEDHKILSERSNQNNACVW